MNCFRRFLKADSIVSCGWPGLRLHPLIMVFERVAAEELAHLRRSQVATEGSPVALRDELIGVLAAH